MHPLSEEQEYINSLTKKDINIIVEAVAGAGKTTAILMIAKESPDKKILQLTYNSSLRLEVKSRVKENDLSNIRVHTFHSLAKRYYDTPGFTTDTELRAIVKGNQPPKEPIPPFDLLVPDECQDMTLLYFRFLIKFIRDMGSPIQLLILGDSMQGLYDFKGADIRFLTLAQEIWRGFPLLKSQEFVKATMSMSFRITNQICSFVNDVMLGEPRMKACREDMKTMYIRNDKRTNEIIFLAEIKKLFEKGVKYEDVFILGPSIKANSYFMHSLENMLVNNNIPCYFPSTDGDKIDDRVIDRKVVFSTFHCVKGRQRKYVFVVGFDYSYFRYYAQTLPEDLCPNTLYVAATRAIHGLFLLESGEKNNDRPLPFLKMSHFEMKNQPYVNFRGMHKTLFDETEEEKITRFEKITVTELIRFQDSAIEEIYPLLETLFVKETEAEKELEFPNIVQTEAGFFEEVSDINGVAIPAMYFDSLYSRCCPTEIKKSLYYDMVQRQLYDTKSSEHIFLKQKFRDVPENMETINDYLMLANIQLAIQDKLYFKIKQISPSDHTWIPSECIQLCHDRMDGVIRADCQEHPPMIEKNLFDYKEDESHVLIDACLESVFGEEKRFRFQGRLDLVTDTTVWEIKCTGNLTVEHMLQLVIYKWLWDMSLNPPKQFRLFNIKTGEILRLESTQEQLDTIMIALLKGKYQRLVPKEDDDFIAECRACFLTPLNIYNGTPNGVPLDIKGQPLPINQVEKE